MFTLTVLDQSGKQIDKIELDKQVFDGKVNKALLHQVITMYQANQRQGTAATKTRAMVSGGNSKPWKQKGTGRARVGSSRNPLWRKGGIVFGPHPRDYSVRIPQKMKKAALLSSLNSRLQDELVRVLDKLEIESGKTKDFIQVLKMLKLDRKVLVVCDEPGENLLRSCRNIPEVIMEPWQNLNALSVLSNHTLVFTREALDRLTDRLKKEKGE